MFITTMTTIVVDLFWMHRPRTVMSR